MITNIWPWDRRFSGGFCKRLPFQLPMVLWRYLLLSWSCILASCRPCCSKHSCLPSPVSSWPLPLETQSLLPSHHSLSFSFCPFSSFSFCVSFLQSHRRHLHRPLYRHHFLSR